VDLFLRNDEMCSFECFVCKYCNSTVQDAVVSLELSIQQLAATLNE